MEVQLAVSLRGELTGAAASEGAGQAAVSEGAGDGTPVGAVAPGAGPAATLVLAFASEAEPQRLSIPIYTCRRISGQLGPDGPSPFPRRAFNVVRHGKSIYRGGHLTMSATVNRVFTVADILRCPLR